jgi:chromosome segregation ATPase
MEEKKMTLDDLKKEDYLLVFMLNHEASDLDPFTTRVNGQSFINYGGTKNTSSLQSMLQTLKRKNLVVNVFPGAWALTKKGKKEAEHWLKKCGREPVKQIFLPKEDTKKDLKEKLALAEAELDGLRVEITMANHTNEYLDEQIQLLREENSKLKEKIALVQKAIA